MGSTGLKRLEVCMGFLKNIYWGFLFSRSKPFLLFSFFIFSLLAPAPTDTLTEAQNRQFLWFSVFQELPLLEDMDTKEIYPTINFWGKYHQGVLKQLPDQKKHLLNQQFFNKLLTETKQHGLLVDPDSTISGVVGGIFTSSYGIRRNPFKRRKRFRNVFYATGGKTEVFHRGEDYAALRGTPIYLKNRKALITNISRSPAYGLAVEARLVPHLYIFMAHLSRSGVKKHQEIPPQKPLGFVGNSGFSTGNHLHLEYRVKNYLRNKAWSIPRDNFQALLNSSFLLPFLEVLLTS